MSRIEQRITGIENEWSIVYPDADARTLVPLATETIDDMIEACLPPYLIKANSGGGMLSNGGRIYKDMSYFIEYATPEDTSFDGTIANELASERIILDMMARAIKDDIIPEDAELHKRVISDTNETWGYHVSFTTDAKKVAVESASDMNALGMHLATMNIYAGAGMLRNESSMPMDRGGSPKLRYALAQKVLNLNDDFSTHSHGNTQPLICTKREELSRGHGYGRLHVTSLDAHISPWATKMSLGTIAIVLRLMEEGYQGYKVQDIMPAAGLSMHQVAKTVAYDTDLTYAMPRSYTSKSFNSQLRALDIQRMLLTHAAELDLPKQELEVWHEWKRALDTLEDNPNKLIEADWVARRALINRRTRDIEDRDERDRKRLHWNNQYDRLDLPERYNIPHALRTRTFKQHMPAPALIAERMEYPPQTTRALQRSQIIRAHPDAQVSWDRVSYADPAAKRSVNYDLTDPYASDAQPYFGQVYGFTPFSH